MNSKERVERERVTHYAARRSARLLGFAVAVASVAILLGPAVGGARADLIGLPTFIGFVTNDGYFFVEVGTSSFGTFTPVSPGSSVFGTGFTIVVFGLTAQNRSVDVRYVQNGSGGLHYANTTFVATGHALTIAQLTFPPTTQWASAILTIDGVSLHYRVETPILLLPLTNLTNGGFDIIILGVLSEYVVFAFPLVVLARYLTRKALWAPKVKAILWLHGIILGIAAFVILDFPLVNETIGGWGWFTYPIPLVVFTFFWSASLFNRAEVVEVLRANTAGGHRLAFDRWEIRVGRNFRGDLVLLGRRWRDWLFGIFGHHVVLSPRDAEEKGAEPQGHAVALGEIGYGTQRAKEQVTLLRGKIRWPRASKEKPEDDFRVRNSQERGEDDPSLIYFVASSDPVEVEWPRLSFRRWKKVEAKYDREGNEVRPAGQKEALTWPHILDGKATIRLSSIHYADVVAVAMGWKTVEDVVKVAEQRHLQVYILKAHMRNEIARQVEEKLLAYLDLTTSAEEEMPEEEASEEVERPSRRRRSGREPPPPSDMEPAEEGTEEP